MATADDQARLLVSIEANQRAFAKQMQMVAKQSADAAKHIEDNFRKANDNAAGSFSRSGKVVERSLGAQRAAVQNLSFQLNDIATSLAGGASPFTVMAQQGGQVTQVLSGAGGITGAIKLVGGALGSLINPTTAVTFGVIYLTGKLVEYFTTADEGAAKSDEALKAHVDLIAAVAKEWGDAVPALKAYADAAQKAKDTAQLKEATQIYIDDVFKQAREQVQGLTVDLVDVASQLEAAGASGENVEKIRDAFNRLKGAIDAGRDSTKENQELTGLLINEWLNTGVSSAQSFASSIHGIAEAFAAVAKQADAARRQQDAALGVGGDKGIVPFSPLPADDTNRRVQLQAARESISRIESGGNYRALGPVLESGDRAYGKYQVMGSNIAQWTKDAIGTVLTPEQFLNNPDFQDKVFDHIFGGYIDQFGMQGASEAWFAGPGGVGKRDRKDALGTSVGDYSAKFKQNIDQWEGLRDVTASTRQETAALTQEYSNFGQVAQTALDGLVNAFADGKLEGRELLQIVSQIIQQLFSLPGGGLGGGGGFGGILSGILGSIFHEGGVVGGRAPQRMVSPSVFAGAKRYHSGGVAGLQPGEVPAILQRGEVVLPKGTRMAQGGAETININLQADQSVIATIADQRIRTASGNIVNVAVSRSNASAPAAVAKHQVQKTGGDYRNS